MSKRKHWNHNHQVKDKLGRLVTDQNSSFEKPHNQSDIWKIIALYPEHKTNNCKDITQSYFDNTILKQKGTPVNTRNVVLHMITMKRGHNVWVARNMHATFQKQKHDHTCVNKKIPMPSTQNFEIFKPSDGSSSIYYGDLSQYTWHRSVIHQTCTITQTV